MRFGSFAVLLCALPVYGGSIYSTSFESGAGFNVGTVNGQDGWNVPGNSPTVGNVDALPSGSPTILGAQGLHLFSTGNSNLFGVANGLTSPWIDPAGEPGATPSPAAGNHHFNAEFWYRTPAAWSGGPGSYIVGLNPASTVGGRYAWFGPVVAANGQVDFTITAFTDTDNAVDVAVYNDVKFSTWYRLVYDLFLNDGTNGTGPNDLFSVSVYDPQSNLLGSANSSTWEMPWRTGAFDGLAKPRGVQGLDLLQRWGPASADLGFIDNVTMSTDAVPEPGTLGMICFGLMAVVIGRRRRR